MWCGTSHTHTHLESLKSADGSLREDVSIERAERQTDVSLCESELDASLFELARERLQVVRRRCLTQLVLFQAAAITASGGRSARHAVRTRRWVGDLISTTPLG